MRTRNYSPLSLLLLVTLACTAEGPGSETGGSGGAPVIGAGGLPAVGGAASGGAPGTGGLPGVGGVVVGTGGAVLGAGGAVLGSGGAGAAPAGGSAAGGGGGGGGASGGAAGSGGTPAVGSCPFEPPTDPASFPSNWSSQELITFNDNGGWTWYNDERVVVDPEGGKLIIGSAASNASNQGASPQIEAVTYDLANGTKDKMVLGSLSYSDDHNNPGILVKAPGEYFFAWAHHNVDCTTYFRNYGGGAWAATGTFNWSSKGCPWGTSQSHVTYNNPWNMSSENKYYNFVRSVDTSPNFLVSTDQGKTWAFAGRLTASPQQGYNAGYYKYWGNGVDRIDFFATEAHPRDADTSLYHGYVKGGKSYNSTDVEKDATIADATAPQIKDFTTVFTAGGMLDGVGLHCLWNFDVARYADGTIAVLWQGREGGCGKDNTTPNHRIAYSRFDGTKWTSTYLVHGGETLYSDRSDWWEEDYLGGAALDPDDPSVVYVSTTYDPRDDTTIHPKHEIWKGVTCDSGATFEWTPITMNSQEENVRPVVPKWDDKKTALLWFRGKYNTAQKYDASVVGMLIDDPAQ